MALTALLMGEIAGAAATGGVGTMAAIKATPAAAAWRGKRRENKAPLEHLRREVERRDKLIRSYLELLGDHSPHVGENYYRGKPLYDIANKRGKIAHLLPWMEEKLLLSLSAVLDDETALLNSLPCECKRWSRGRLPLRTPNPFASDPIPFAPNEFHHPSIMIPFLESYGKLVKEMRAIREEGEARKAAALTPRGEAIAQVPLKSLGERAITKEWIHALEAAGDALGECDGELLFDAVEQLGARAGENILLESRIYRYLGNIREAQRLGSELGEGALVDGIPVEQLVNTIVEGNAAQLRDEVVAPRSGSTEDALLTLANYSRDLREGR